MERRCWVNFQCRGVLLVWMIVGQGPIALAVGADGGCLDIFSLIYLCSFLSPSLWETARYRLKYCLKGPLNPKQPTNQISLYRVVSQRNGVKREMIDESWLVGCFGFHGSLRQYLSLYQAVSQREGERKKTDERNNVQTNPHLHLLQAQKALALL